MTCKAVVLIEEGMHSAIWALKIPTIPQEWLLLHRGAFSRFGPRAHKNTWRTSQSHIFHGFTWSWQMSRRRKTYLMHAALWSNIEPIVMNWVRSLPQLLLCGSKHPPSHNNQLHITPQSWWNQYTDCINFSKQAQQSRRRQVPGADIDGVSVSLLMFQPFPEPSTQRDTATAATKIIGHNPAAAYNQLLMPLCNIEVVFQIQVSDLKLLSDVASFVAATCYLTAYWISQYTSYLSVKLKPSQQCAQEVCAAARQRSHVAAACQVDTSPIAGGVLERPYPPPLTRNPLPVHPSRIPLDEVFHSY
ncbi:MAG: hypothetical protein FRX49_13148 [Trebouxia sp. A1-2]|nr:MAG: hypothetical protein FRX49_13148 [Trebouxia sp. A1-2]